MKDFTLQSYSRYLRAIKSSGVPFYRFDDFMERPVSPETFCLVRHDVDRKPKNALEMAQLEQEMGVVSTYYFRKKPQTFKPAIIKEIAAMGHEIGYHYESLSDAKGDMKKAVALYERDLAAFRAIVPIRTTSMHGRPLLPYDNRDIWKDAGNHQHLVNNLNILGEVYLDIDYSEIAYINDTGRNWTSGKANKRDKVDSKINADFESSEALLYCLTNNTPQKMVFQIHPERWTDRSIEWMQQKMKDGAINLVKALR